MADTPRILVHNDQTSALAETLLARFPDVACETCNSYDGLAQQVESFQPDIVYTVRFSGTTGYPRDALFGPNGPKWISNGGAGTDHLGQWDADKVTVTNAAGVAADMMAEYILGTFLHFTLDVPGLQADQAARVWNNRTVVPLSGKTILIVGLGNTGRALAARAKAFGMTVLGTRANPVEMDHVDEVHAADTLTALMPRADFVAIATPLTSATRGLISAVEIAAMKPGVILADVSRGGVVDQSALYNALHSGHVAAAALDVFEVEPLPEDSPFWALQNVLISPHCSSVYAEWDAASFALFLNNVDRWRKGEALTNIVSPTRGY